MKKDLATASKRNGAVPLLKGPEEEESVYVLKTVGLAEKRTGEPKKETEAGTGDDEDAEILRSIPGVGPLVSTAFLACAGDPVRFDNASRVGNYPGLTPRVDIPCPIAGYGGITKRGNGILRGLPVQAARSAVRSNNGGALRERSEYFKGRSVNKKKPVAGIARRPAGPVYTMMKEKKVYGAGKFIPSENGAYIPGVSG